MAYLGQVILTIKRLTLAKVIWVSQNIVTDSAVEFVLRFRFRVSPGQKPPALQATRANLGRLPVMVCWKGPSF